MAAPGAIQGGGNGDGWTTGKHRNADAVCVKQQTSENTTGVVSYVHVFLWMGEARRTLSYFDDRCNTRHRRGADPARERRQSSRPARETVDYGNTGG